MGRETYAWFTMNKQVSVVNMQVKAHAEEGLLINEVALATSPTWDEQAQGNTVADTKAISLRPASTLNLVTWWHANSKKSADEAGVDAINDTVDVDGSGTKYVEVSSTATGITDKAIVTAAEATGNVKAETHVYYKDASFGSGSVYDDGEGFYVVYKYYLKSSGDKTLTVKNLQAQVKADKVANSGSSDDLDPALRVGVKYGDTGMKIFAPIPGTSGSGATNKTYGVTTNATGTASNTVTPVVASAVGFFTDYTKINTEDETIPNVNTNGDPLYVYVWFEGEDTHCMSDNLTTALAAYDITVNIKDADLDTY